MVEGLCSPVQALVHERALPASALLAQVLQTFAPAVPLRLCTI